MQDLAFCDEVIITNSFLENKGNMLKYPERVA